MTNKLFLQIAKAASLAGLIGLASAAITPAFAGDDAKDAIAQKLPGVDAKDIKSTPINGVYEISLGSNIAYVDNEGRYLIRGDLYDLNTNVNLTETRRSVARSELMRGVGENTISFGPANAKDVKHEVTVFTDIDCGYCRKLHREMAQYNAVGIKVNYVFYPRSGPGSDSWKKAEGVWCADDRQAALTAAKSGADSAPPVASVCGTTPVSEHWELGQSVGLRGTPAIVTQNGTLIAGYLPANNLLSRLQTEVPSGGGAR